MLLSLFLQFIVQKEQSMLGTLSPERVFILLDLISYKMKKEDLCYVLTNNICPLLFSYKIKITVVLTNVPSNIPAIISEG